MTLVLVPSGHHYSRPFPCKYAWFVTILCWVTFDCKVIALNPSHSQVKLPAILNSIMFLFRFAATSLLSFPWAWQLCKIDFIIVFNILLPCIDSFFPCIILLSTLLQFKKGSHEWLLECSFAKCDVGFVGKRQVHSKLFNKSILYNVNGIL